MIDTALTAWWNGNAVREVIHMATEEEVEEAIDDLGEQIAEVCDDTRKWSQEESAQIFEGVADVCVQRARTIRSEMQE
jgi:hypothetical protein